MFKIASYLASRELIIRINENLSDSFIADCGVSQGSHLGPLLFIIFINDIGDIIKTVEFQAYPDNIKIHFRINALADQVELQKVLNKIYNWSLMNNLRLNVSKCKVLLFVEPHASCNMITL